MWPKQRENSDEQTLQRELLWDRISPTSSTLSLIHSQFLSLSLCVFCGPHPAHICPQLFGISSTPLRLLFVPTLISCPIFFYVSPYPLCRTPSGSQWPVGTARQDRMENMTKTLGQRFIKWKSCKSLVDYLVQIHFVDKETEVQWWLMLAQGHTMSYWWNWDENTLGLNSHSSFPPNPTFKVPNWVDIFLVYWLSHLALVWYFCLQTVWALSVPLCSPSSTF